VNIWYVAKRVTSIEAVQLKGAAKSKVTAVDGNLLLLFGYFGEHPLVFLRVGFHNLNVQVVPIILYSMP
jgi:hypothetical protein